MAGFLCGQQSLDSGHFLDITERLIFGDAANADQSPDQPVLEAAEVGVQNRLSYRDLPQHAGYFCILPCDCCLWLNPGFFCTTENNSAGLYVVIY